MKKYFLFSLLVFSSFLILNKNVFAGGYACTTKGWVACSGSSSCSEAGCTGTADPIFTDNPNVKPGETVIFADYNTITGECIPTDTTKSDDDQEGDFRVKLKTYDCNGNEESKKIEGSKVKLYERDGDKVETDKTNSKGEANFRDIETGKYKVKCEVDGYVSMKDKSKTAYESGYEKVKDGERATETCRLIKKSCEGSKLAKTGGSLFDYVFSLF